MHRLLLPLGACVLLSACGREERVPLHFVQELTAKGLLVVPPVDAQGNAPLIAVDPVTGAGLELLVRRADGFGAIWTAILLKNTLADDGLSPGVIDTGSGPPLLDGFEVQQAIVRDKSTAFFAPAAKDVEIPGFGVPFKEIHSPRFLERGCRSFDYQVIDLELPPIVDIVASGLDLFVVAQDRYERAPDGRFRRRRTPLGPPVLVELLRDADSHRYTAGPFTTARADGFAQQVSGFFTALGRSHLGKIAYATFDPAPGGGTTLWLGGGIQTAFEPARTLPGLEIRHLALEDGLRSIFDVQASDSSLLRVEVGPTPIAVLESAGTSSRGLCRGDEAAPAIDCGGLRFDYSVSTLSWVGVDGLGPVRTLDQSGRQRAFALERSDARTVNLNRGPTVALTSSGSGALVSFAGEAPVTIWEGPPIYGVADTGSTGTATIAGTPLVLDRAGSLFEVLRGQSCPAILSAPQARRLLSAPGVVVLLEAGYAEAGQSRQRLVLIWARS
ncbi:MAG: hypothetical protein U1E65_11730 [Myxococcota bacterium]